MIKGQELRDKQDLQITLGKKIKKAQNNPRTFSTFFLYEISLKAASKIISKKCIWKISAAFVHCSFRKCVLHVKS